MHTKRVVGSCNRLCCNMAASRRRAECAETISKSFSRWHCSCIVFLHARNSLSPAWNVPSPSLPPLLSFRFVAVGRLKRSRRRISQKKKEMFSLDRRESGALATSAKIREIFIDRSCTHSPSRWGLLPSNRAPPRALRRAILVVAT